MILATVSFSCVLLGYSDEVVQPTKEWSHSSFADYFEGVSGNGWWTDDDENGPHFGYGEVSLEAIDKLLNEVPQQTGVPLGIDDVLVDLGSGRGRIVFWSVLSTEVGAAYGVELSAARHRLSLSVLGASVTAGVFSKRVGDDEATSAGGRRIHFRQADILATSDIWGPGPTIVFIYIRNLREQQRVALAHSLAENLKPGTIVLTSQPLFGCHRGLTHVHEIAFPPSVFTGGRFQMYMAMGRVALAYSDWLTAGLPSFRLLAERHELLHLTADLSITPDKGYPCLDESMQRTVLQEPQDRLFGVLGQRLGISKCGETSGQLTSAVQRIIGFGDADDGWSCVFQWLHWTPTGSRGFNLPESENQMLGRAGTYGEIKPYGVLHLLNALRYPLKPDDEVLDLGSGTGRVVLQLLLASEAGDARGIELSPTRHALAAQALARFLNTSIPGAPVGEGEGDVPQFVDGIWQGRRVAFERGDLYSADLGRAALVYCNTQAFPDDMVWRLGEKLAMELPVRSTAFILGRPLFPCHALADLSQFEIATTWATATPAFVYGLAAKTDSVVERAAEVVECFQLRSQFAGQDVAALRVEL